MKGHHCLHGGLLRPQSVPTWPAKHDFDARAGSPSIAMSCARCADDELRVILVYLQCLRIHGQRREGCAASDGPPISRVNNLREQYT